MIALKRFLIIVSALGTVAAMPTASASAATAPPADKLIYLQGDTQNGWFFWDGQPDPWVPNYKDIKVASGSTRFFFVWGHGSSNPGYHNVTLNKTARNLAWRSGTCTSTSCTKTTATGLTKFTNSKTQQNLGGTDIRFPTAGWVPTATKKKKALYSFVCSLHPSMVMRIYVQG